MENTNNLSKMLENSMDKISIACLCRNHPRKSIAYAFSRKELELQELPYLIQKVKQQYESERVYLDEFSLLFKNIFNVPLSSILDLFPLYFDYKKIPILKHEPNLTLKAKLPDGKVFYVKCNEQMTVGEFESQIPMNLKKFYICFPVRINGKKTNKNFERDKLMADIGILNNSEVFIYPIVIGYAQMHSIKPGHTFIGNSRGFVNMSNDNYTDLTVSSNNPNIPKWRAVSSGINIFGHCHNKNCKANKEEVICPMEGKDIFDLILDGYKVKCPMCDKNFIPETTGLYDCSYTWTGQMIKDNEIKLFRNQKFVKTEEKKIRYFDVEKNGTVEWIALKIIVSTQYGLNKCGLCQRSGELSEIECGHLFHKDCLKTNTKTLNNKCILCL